MGSKSLSFLEIQKGIFFDCQVSDSASYTIAAALQFYQLDVEVLQQALQLVAHEQPVMRSFVTMEEGEPQLVIAEQMELGLQLLEHIPAQQWLNDAGEIADEVMSMLLAEPIDLYTGPLFQFYVSSKLNNDAHICVIKAHHLVCDGLSLELLKARLLHYYDKLTAYQPIELQVDEGFLQYIELENKKLAQGKYKKQQQYWLNKMQDAEPLHIPPDKATHHEQGGLGRELRFPIACRGQIEQCAKQLEVTPYIVYMSVFSLLMGQFSSNQQVVFTTPFTHRPKLSMEQAVGCFVHMLPLSVTIDEQLSFAQFVEQTQQHFIQTYKNLGYPNNLIARDSKQMSMPGAPSIFNISFVHDVIAGEDNSDANANTTYIASNVVTFPGQIMAVVEQSEHAQQFKLQYKPQVFTEASMKLLGERFVYLLQQISEQPEKQLLELQYVLPEEQELLVRTFNQSSHFPYVPQSIIERFQQRAAQHPGRVALLDGQRQLTYHQVERAVDQLALRLLVSTKGEARRVGIHMQRSIEMVVAILAVLRAGSAYVPLDPGYPVKRKTYILQDAEISCIITDQSCELDEALNVMQILFTAEELQAYQLTTDKLLPDKLTQDELAHDTLSQDEQLQNNVTPDKQSAASGTAFPEPDPYSLAYIMYTSGSTGNPKGVMIEQHSVVNTLLDLERRFPMEADSIFMLKTAYTFDVSATELFGWFIGEGALFVLEPEGEKNPQLIVDWIERARITHLNFVPTMFRLFLEVLEHSANLSRLASLNYIFVGGEAITPELLTKFYQLQLDVRLENVYGPTECTIWMSHYELAHYSEQAHVPIGYPLNEARWYVVGKRDQLQPIGVVGELCLSGAGLARGYVNMAELTAEKFVTNPFYNEDKDPPHFKLMYRTGDLVRWLPSGTIEYIGRIDFQVKLHGVRLEAGEIESALSSHPHIVQAVVVLKKLTHSSRLYAFYLSEHEVDGAELKSFLTDYLPAYMIPEHYIHVQQIPKNSSGKADRKALLALLEDWKEEQTSYVPPQNELEQKVASIWEQVLQLEQPSVETPFFELGGTSIGIIQAHSKLQRELSIELPITALFQYVTIRQLAQHIASLQAQLSPHKQHDEKRTFVEARQSGSEKTIEREDIAIIGLSVRVPGADNVEQFWSNLVNGVESIHVYSDDELRQLGIDEELIANPNYVKAKGRVEGIESFDHIFFDYTPGEVQMMSPQYRLMYKGVWDAFEDAGYDPTTGEQRIGLYLGGSDDFEWYRHMLLSGDAYSDQYQTFTLSTNHFLATRIAYKFNLRGPVYSALTGCSTSLVTPHLACQALQLGECDMAAAGGITVELPNEGGYLYEDGMMFSADGHCRPFDAAASGTMFSNGLGVAILKRLGDAVRDGDHIYGVIKGSAINNDGNSKLGFLAPSVEGQVDAIVQAYERAQIDPHTISYVEAHGTGTLLGDPIEVASLTEAFQVNEQQQCVLGSVKGNVGHMDTAAGIVGLAKVALSLKHRYLPGTLHYETPNPKINFAETPFVVQRDGMAWQPAQKAGGLLRAGINSFGVGGTNAHMIIEQAPSYEKERGSRSRYHMVLVSAKTATALERNAEQLASYMLHHPELETKDVAWTLQVGRKHFSHRKAIVVAEGSEENAEQWLELQQAAVKQALPVSRKIVFMFPGQGSQYQGMARDLLNSESSEGLAPRFRKHMEQLLAYVPQEQHQHLLHALYGGDETQAINQTQYSQLAIFITSYAMAQSLIELGIVPDALIGHSIGELVAAAVAGVFSAEDAVALVAKRGQLMQEQPAGIMLAVMSPAAHIEPLLANDPQVDKLHIALYNSSSSCVVGGSAEQIAYFQQLLDKKSIKHAVIKTSHAFHTPSMAGAAEQFQQYLMTVSFQAPRYPALANVTGDWVDPKLWMTPGYWARHIAEPVRFEQNLEKVLGFREAVFIEVGAGRTLSTFARGHQAKKEQQQFVSMLRHPQQQEDDERFVTARLAELWCCGVAVNARVWYEGSACYRVSLPTYQYDEHSYPIGFNVPNSASSRNQTDGISHVNGEAARSTVAPSLAASVQAGQAAQGAATIAALPLVLEAYYKLFGHQQLNEQSDFFELGGDSLKAVSLAGSIQQLTGVKLGISTLFDCATPLSLAAHLEQHTAAQHIGGDTKRHAERRTGQDGGQHTTFSHHSAAVTSSTATVNGQYNTLSHQPESGVYPLSSAQIRMYTLASLDKQSIAWNVPSATLIYGKLDEQRMRQALQHTLLRHEALRTSFRHDAGELKQIVHAEVELPIDFTDYRQQVISIEQLVEQFVRPFDLTQAPLIRVEVARLQEQQYVLLFDVHHIIADGTSVELITDDFNRSYFGDSLEPAPAYRQYVSWLQEQRLLPDYEQHKQYWLNKLGAPRARLELPTDYRREQQLSSAGERVHFEISTSLVTRLKALAGKQQASMNMVMLAAWNMLLYSCSQQSDMIIGTAVAGRSEPQFAKTVGMFVNMLPLRNTVSPADSFTGLLQSVKRTMLEALSHQQFQFDDLVHVLSLPREMNRNVLFDVCFDYQNMTTYQLEMDGLRFEPYDFDLHTATYDLLLTCHEHQQSQTISGFMEYRTALYRRSTIEAMIAALLQLLELIAEDERATIGSYITGGKLGVKHNNRAQALYAQVEEQFAQYALQPAIVNSNGEIISYEQLQCLVEQLGSALTANRCQAGDKIAIMLGRTAYIHVAMLACIKHGITFVPIDPGLPAERIAYMVRNSEVSYVLCDAKLAEQGFATESLSAPLLSVERLLSEQQSGMQLSSTPLSLWKQHRQEQSAFDPAAEYHAAENNEVWNGAAEGRQPLAAAHIYTSGSTGQPKGVQISYDSLLNFIEDVRERRLFANPADRIFSVTTASFDIFLFESLVPLCLGRSICLANEQEQLDPALAARKITAYRCTHILSTVSRIKAFVEHSSFAAGLRQLRYILTGGENVPASLVEFVHQHSGASMFNMYGPTETTIWSTVQQLHPSQAVTIGRPIRNTQVYIVNEHMEQQPTGEYGELLIGGAGVSSGYVNDPGKTAQQFIVLPKLSASRLYRTGDRARLLANGEIQLLGRLDTQVKIRGYRVELSEIEEQLLACPQVKYAVASVRGQHTPYAQIIAFVSLDDGVMLPDTQAEQLIKQQLGKQLPQYMMPARIVVLAQMPCLPNGKLDRKQLAGLAEGLEYSASNGGGDSAAEVSAAGEAAGTGGEVKKQAPAYMSAAAKKMSRKELEQRLLALWQETLQRSDVRLNDNYFDLGGQSLGLITIHSQLVQWLTDELLLIKLFEYPTIASLLDYAAQAGMVEERSMRLGRIDRVIGDTALSEAVMQRANEASWNEASMQWTSEAVLNEAAMQWTSEAALNEAALDEAAMRRARETVLNEARRQRGSEAALNEAEMRWASNTALSEAVMQRTSRAAAPKTSSNQPASQSTASPLPSMPPDGTKATDIAVIGMACRFPGASTVAQYWENLLAGVESITSFSEEELLQSGVPLEDIRSPHYVPRKGYLDDVAYFDHQFFQYSAHESNAMDPQLRLLHEVTWQALEDGGYNSHQYEGKIGFFAGSGLSTPWLTTFIGEQRDLVQLFEAMTLNEKDYVTTRISYKLNLRGPSANVQTACSTSLVAIHQAIQSLLQGEADMALAGGVSLSYPLKEGYMWHEGMIYAKDGSCRPFSKDATGTLSGNGCGVVLLKRLDQALQDGDHIYAIVKGSAINNDGHDKIGYTAPSISGQKDVIQQALSHGNINPQQIRYVEAHGTGTQLGDPIELNALQQAWRTDEKQYCAIGSVKANIGHLDAAAGVAGFIKAVCIAGERVAPPLINYTGEHPQLELAQTPFYINTVPLQLADKHQPISVAVSSFGIGGTNAHILLGSPPAVSPETRQHSDSDIVIIPLSARTEQALQRNCQQLQEWIGAQHSSALPLERIAWTMQTGRAAFSYRQAYVIEQGKLCWEAPYQTNEQTDSSVQAEQSLWYFSHQLPLYKGITSGLYRSLLQTPITARYEEQVNELLELLQPRHQQELKQMMREGKAKSESGSSLFSYIVQISLYTALQQLELEPDRLIGEGVGELVAWTLCGKITAAEAIAAIYETEQQIWSELTLGALEAACYDNQAWLKLPRALQRLVQQAAQRTIRQSSQQTDNGMSPLWTDRLLYVSSACHIDEADEWELFIWLAHKKTIVVHMIEEQCEQYSFNTAFSSRQQAAVYPVSLLSARLHQTAEMEEATLVMRAIARCWCYGQTVAWASFYEQLPQKLPLPAYSFERIHHQHDVKLTTMLGIDKSLSAAPRSSSSPAALQFDELSQEQLRELLCKGWHEQLGEMELSPQADFFELGGQSLHVIALVAYIKRAMHIEVTIEDMFSHSQMSNMLKLLTDRYEQQQAERRDQQLIRQQTGREDQQPVQQQEGESAQQKARQLAGQQTELNVEQQAAAKLEAGLEQMSTSAVAGSSYAVSSAQKRMYIVQEMLGEATPYNLASFYKLSGKLDTNLFNEVIDTLVARHEAFRTSFHMRDGQLYQHIHEQVPSAFEHIACSEQHFAEQHQSYVQPFDLSQPVLLRVKLFQFAEDAFGLMIDMHHIISDQMSIAILLDEVAALYDGQQLPMPQVQYRHFADWQNNWLQSAALLQQKQYWLEQFSDAPAQVELATEADRAGAYTTKGEKLSFTVPQTLQSNLLQYCQQMSITPYMLFMGALQLLLWKYTGSSDIVVGTAIAGRREQQWHAVVGMFVNMLPIKTHIDEQHTAEQYIAHLKKQLLRAFDNQDYQYEMLVDELQLEKQKNRNPLFDIVLNYINMGTEQLQFGELELQEYESNDINCKFDMTWTLLDKQGSYSGDVEFNCSLYQRQLVERMIERYMKVLEFIVSSSEKAVPLSLSQLTLWDEQDERWLTQCNDTATDYPAEATIPQLFVEQVQQTPDHIALRFAEQSLTYAQLNNCINALADQLKQQGLQPGQRVAIYLSRGPMQIISIYAVLKLGCIYVPIDTEQPLERTAFMLQDSEAGLLITEQGYADDLASLHEVKQLMIEQFQQQYDGELIYNEPDVSELSALDPVYIIYTSGSTGMPKGVLICHRNVVKVVRNNNFIKVTDQDRILQLSTYAFDGSVFDIFASLLNGASLVLISKQQLLDLAQLAATIEQQHISAMFITTSLFNLLVDEQVQCMRHMRCIMFGGEAASYTHVRKAAETIGGERLFNVYGPTETTYIASYYCPGDDELPRSIPIGRPISNTEMYVLDEHGRPLPAHVVGELYIGGDGVGLGYVNRPQLTAERFIASPFTGGGRLYRTGDRVWRRLDGTLVYVERADFQVKIRGFRIELGEVEASMRQLCQVKDAIVVVNNDQQGSQYLAAYYTEPAMQSIAEHEVYERLQAHLPDYMVPKRILRLEKMPLTLNGKIDRHKLPPITAIIRQHQAVAARNPLEQLILQQMQAVLDIEVLGIHDDFFQAGGQSLKGIALLHGLKQHGIELTMQDLFSHPTVCSLAELPKLQQLALEVVAGSSEADTGTEREAAKQRDAASRWHEVEADYAASGTLAINLSQMSAVVEHIKQMNELLAQWIINAAELRQFSLSPMQKVHAAKGSLPSGFMTTLNVPRQAGQVKRRIVELICQHQLLHSVLDPQQQAWRQAELSAIRYALEQVIPYFDLSTMAEGKQDLIEQLAQALLLAPYEAGKLPWRLALLKLSATEYRVIWGIDHMIFDGMSGQILQQQLQAEAEADQPLVPDGAGSSYEQYIALLAQGPQHVSGQQMIDCYQLEQWRDAQQQWEQAWQEQAVEESSSEHGDQSSAGKQAAQAENSASSLTSRELEVKLPLEPAKLEGQWWSALHGIVQAMCSYFAVPQLPLAVVHYGRQYGEQKFFNCVGEFLDLVPLPMSQHTTEQQWFDKLEHAKRHHINFMSLLHDEGLAEQFACARQMLHAAFDQPQQPIRCILFNFQGYIAAEDRISAQWQADEQHEPGLAELTITANYDQTHLYFHIDSTRCMNMQSLADQLSKSLQDADCQIHCGGELITSNQSKGEEVVYGR